MNKLDTTQETSSSWSPYTVETKKFIQDAYTEAFKNTLIGIIGASYSASVPYIMFGCKTTGSDPGARTLSAGAIFYNGEIYTVPSASVTTSGSQVLVGTITVTNDPVADPSTFSDNTSHNIHNIRTIVFSNALSGTGTFDFSACVTIKKYYASFSDMATQFNVTGTAYADFSTPIELTTPNDGATRNYLATFVYYNDTQAAAATCYLDLKITDGVTDFISQDSGKISATAGEFAIPGCMIIPLTGVAPNTTIKVQGKYIGASGDIKKVCLTLLEI